MGTAARPGPTAPTPRPRRRSRRRRRTTVLPDLSDLVGRTAVVTGANSGLGLVTATELAAAGARVVLAVRSLDKGRQAADRIRDLTPNATVSVLRLDLADLDSVASFADEVAGLVEHVDILVNNAGIMLVPERQLTRQGFELQLGTNFLGHFALVGRLWSLLTASTTRIVSLGSLAHRTTGRLRHDLGLTGRYGSLRTYAQSKLACMLFGFELDRRAKTAGWPITSVVAHPGYSATSLFTRQENAGPIDRLTALVTPLVGTTPEHGALSQLRAATDPTLTGGEFVGPRWLMSGPPALVRPARNARRRDDAAWLWARAEELTGVTI